MNKKKIIAAFMAFSMSFGAIRVSGYSPGISTAAAAVTTTTASNTTTKAVTAVTTSAAITSTTKAATAVTTTTAIRSTTKVATAVTTTTAIKSTTKAAATAVTTTTAIKSTTKATSALTSASAATTTSSVKTTTYTLGDINNDGYVDAVDSAAVLVHYARISTNTDGKFTDKQLLAADMNHDGIIDAVDASNILAYYALMSTNSSSNYSEESLLYSSLIPMDLEANTTVFSGDPKDYLTPQDFGAKGDGITNDTEAFKKMFQAAYDAAPPSSSWIHAKSIFIPSGSYLITDTLIDEKSNMRYAMFEVNGAGRESTTIKFTAKVLFDNQVQDRSDETKDKPIFSFTTFRGIEFDGNNTNTFMNVNDNPASLDGAQRLQFISCSFQHCNRIINCVESRLMLSEITFAYCKIANCGTEQTPCKLFILTCPQAVNWRFIYTDIEAFRGDAFYYAKGTSISIVGGSIIPLSGNVFNLDLDPQEKAATAGPSNAPHVLCIGARFEIRNASTLLRTTAFSRNTAVASFKYCNLGTSSNNSNNYLVLNGAINASFENCYECGNLKINGNFYTEGLITPKLRFTNCGDLNVKNIFKYAAVTDAKDGLGQNNCHITIDDTYDFYLINNKNYNPNDPNSPKGDYFHTITELSECTQTVKLDESDYVTLNNGKSFKTNPYGFVEYVEVTVPKDDTYANKPPVTLTLFDSGRLTDNKPTRLGNPIQISFDSSAVYRIDVFDYVDELQAVFTHSMPSDPHVTMNMKIVKY